MAKMMTKPWIQSYLYVFEQRGESLDEIGKGYNFHAIIKKPSDKSFNHMIREFACSGNRFCDTSNFHYFNNEFMSDEEKDRKIVYLTGRKADPSKHLKQDMHIIWRPTVNLLSHYNVGII